MECMDWRQTYSKMRTPGKCSPQQLRVGAGRIKLKAEDKQRKKYNMKKIKWADVPKVKLIAKPTKYRLHRHRFQK